MKIKIWTILFIIINFNVLCINNYTKQPRWDEFLDFNDIEYRLNNEKIVNCMPIADYFTYTQQKSVFQCNFKNLVFLVILESGLKAVFKIRDEKMPILSEIAAYRASRLLNLNLVPPVVWRKYKNKNGSLQFFVDFDYKCFVEQEKLMRQVDNKTKNDANIFKFIFGQHDGHAGNEILQKNNKINLALIDNESFGQLQMVKYGQIPFLLFSWINSDYKINKSFYDNVKVLNWNNTKQLHNLFDRYVLPKFGNNKSLNVYKYFSTLNPLRYVNIDNSLWVQRTRRYEIINYCHPDTLAAIKNIDRKFLELIWKEALNTKKPQEQIYIKILFDTILDRKEQLLENIANIPLSN